MSQDKENGCDSDHMSSENFCVFIEDAPKPGLFHSKERFKQLKTLSSPALSLRHILKALLTI
jgi:hypothetical protein